MAKKLQTKEMKAEKSSVFVEVEALRVESHSGVDRLGSAQSLY